MQHRFCMLHFFVHPELNVEQVSVFAICFPRMNGYRQLPLPVWVALPKNPVHSEEYIKKKIYIYIYHICICIYSEILNNMYGI